VATDRGLLVPKIRDVDRKSITELAVELTGLAERTRKGEIDPSEMRGGTFTLTNPGPLGGARFMPIINYPEAAILGLARARFEPVVAESRHGHEIKPRLMLPLCLSFDHRINDGADAARFVSALIEGLGDIESFILAV
jgi:pyruvate dehydrogenase E2 component (dihydrolipoamide acetyltransferase)